ncbi:hypothetical protein ACGF5S_17315 [Nocardia nova]|uniref:hypothetical protein n=1 Tax=Nocardia nova TaxID=37330 RepID=UPI00370F96AC
MRSGTEVDDDPTVGDPEAVVPIDVHIADFLTDLRNMNTPANAAASGRDACPVDHLHARHRGRGGAR